MKRILKVPNLTRVAPGSIAVCELPTGPTYERIRFVASGTGLVVGQIKRINVLMNGVVKQTFVNLQRLIDLNSFYGRSADSVNDFVLHFFSAEFAKEEWKMNPRVGTADLSTFTVEIEIDAAANANVAIRAECLIDTESQPVGVFTAVREYPAAAATAGLFEIANLPKNGAIYKALHLYKTDVAAVELEVGGAKVVDADKAALERFSKDYSPKPRVPVSARATHVDFLVNGFEGDVLNTIGVADMRLKLNLTTAGNVDIQAEMLETLNG